MKVCTKCGRAKPPGKFYKRAASKDGRQHRCKDCCGIYVRQHAEQNRGQKAAQSRRWRRKHPEHYTVLVRRSRLKQHYGLTLAQYETLSAKQNGACAICKRAETQQQHGKVVRLAVDHDHKTGKVRGLLCVACNLALGKMNHDLERLRAAIQYLETCGSE